MDTVGTHLPQRYTAFFTVVQNSTQAVEAQRMSVALRGFGKAVAPEAALELAFDHEIDAATADNVWLRVGLVRIPGAVTMRNSRTLRFQPAEPLRIGEQYVLTAGPELRSIKGLANEPREFRFGVEMAASESGVRSVEYVRDGSMLTVRVRFTVPMSAASADGVKLRAADGSLVDAAPQFSPDGREWLFVLRR